MSTCSIGRQFTDFTIRMLQISTDEEFIHNIHSSASYFANAALTIRVLAVLKARVLAVLR